MKEVLKIGLLALVALVFSGCNGTEQAQNQNENKTYAVSKSIWKSENGGSDWKPKNQAKDKLSSSDLDVLTILLNPKNSSEILAGLKFGGLIKSTDGGENWSKTKFYLERVYGLAYDEGNPSVIYASGVLQKRGKIFKTEDGGENWNELFTMSSDGTFVLSLSVGKSNPKIIYASTSDNQVIKSDDGGYSWKNIYVSSSPVIKIAPDSSNPNLIYLATLNNQTLVSKDGGSTFENTGKNSSKNAVSFGNSASYSTLEVDPRNSGWIYLGGSNGIMRSKDAGASWEKVTVLNDPKKNPISAIAINPKNSQEIMYASGQAVYKSIDGGIHWTTSQLTVEKSITIIKYDHQNPDIVYLGLKKR